MVKSINANGVRYRVIYSNTVLSLIRQDTLIFSVKDTLLNYSCEFTFKFSDSGTPLQAEGGVLPDGNVTYILYGWDGTLEVENLQPLEFVTRLGNRIWLKFSTTSDQTSNRRTFKITVWTEDR